VRDSIAGMRYRCEGFEKTLAQGMHVVGAPDGAEIRPSRVVGKTHEHDIIGLFVFNQFGDLEPLRVAARSLKVW
jgi:hypothetical protein